MSDKVLVDIVRFARTLALSLASRFESAGALQSTLRESGWLMDADPQTFAKVRAALTLVDRAANFASEFTAFINQGVADVGEIARMAQEAAGILDAIVQLESMAGQFSVAPFDKAEFWRDFATSLLDALLIDTLRGEVPIAHAIAVALGIVTHEWTDPGSGAGRLAHERRKIDWNAFSTLLTDPPSHFKTLYGFGGPLNERRLLGVLETALVPLGVAARRKPLSDARASRRSIGRQARELEVPLVEFFGPDDLQFKAGVVVTPVPDPRTPAGAPDRVLISSIATGDTSARFPIAPGLAISLNGGFESDGALAIEIGPEGAAILASPQASIEAGLMLVGTPAEPWIIFGGRKGTRLQVGAFSAGLKLKGNAEHPEFIVKTSFGTPGKDDGIALVLSAGEGDSFVSKILGSGDLSVGMSGQLAWSSINGFTVQATNVGFKKILPCHLSLGPISIDSVALELVSLAGPDAGAGLTVTIAAGAKLGPIMAVVDGLGIAISLRRVKQASNVDRSNFGPLDFAVGFKPPSSVGLAIDTGAVRGGGGLQIHPDIYSGELQLCINQVIDLTAIGIINTKLPGGAAGFALLLLITAKFQPIQLGYGFTLNGVGGLAALNHSMNQQALSDGVRNHTLDSILFPTNPVANANKIISDLQRVFPVTPGRFVFAPMVEIGWGGSVLLIDVALVLDLPSPLRLTILGRMHLLLPPATAGATDDAAKVVVINLDVEGSLDLDEDAISVTAHLYDSRLALFPITGGMAMRIRWGAQPAFLFALGGFNPRFTPPPGFPPLDRVGIQMRYDKGGVRAGLCLTSYFAVTTNTLQFGARIDAYAEVSKAKLAGYLGFDALVDMVPFHVILDLYGGVSVEAFGFKFSCDLLLTLAAFDPVTGDGHVTIDFLGKHEAPIHFSIGDAKPLPALPVADALRELMNALKDVANWSAGVPADTGMVVNLRPPTAAEVTASAGKPLAHPLARLSVRQRVLPFKVALQRFGAATPAHPGPFDIAKLTLGTATAAPPATAALRDDFARGQYLVLSDDDKLCAPQFESFVCGYDGLGTEGARIATPQVAEFSYDTRVIDDRAQPAKSLPDVVVSYDYTRRMVQVGAPPVAAVARYAAPPKGIKVGKPKWKRVGTDNIDANSPDTFDTYTQAQAHRRAQPGAGKQQVVESFELA